MLGCATVSRAPSSDRLARAEILAMLQTLNAELLSHDSATLTLERWCSDHHLADPARISARRARDEVKPIPTDLRERLSIDPHEALGYRHVRLMCGEHVLSEADNWYVPSRLTADMNQHLESTDEPFGKVVKPLGFQRRTLATELLWSPLPPGWDMIVPTTIHEPLRIPAMVLRHEAILYTAAQAPFSAVVETYTNQLFDFGEWAAYRTQDRVR
jgi:chorismate-pyruvate lyase